MADISINARFLTQPITGVQRYALELIKAFDALIEMGEIKGCKFELLVPPCKPLHPLTLKNIPIRRVGFFCGYMWEQLELPFYARKGLLFCPGNMAPFVSLLFGQKMLVTVHDLSYLYFPEAYSLLFKLFYKIVVPLVLKNANAVVTVSNSAKDSILNRYGYASDRLHVIPNGVFSKNNILDKKAKGGESPFVLYVGSLNKRKNLDGILNAAKLLNEKGQVRFVIVGACEKIFSSFKLDSSAAYIDFKGQIDDVEDLIKLYRSASCFVFPSFYESFGFPPLEAMACGCPTIVSTAGSLPETCGDAAVYCDPFNANDIAEKIMLVITNETLQEELRQKGMAQARKFSWERCARETFAVIEKVLNK